MPDGDERLDRGPMTGVAHTKPSVRRRQWSGNAFGPRNACPSLTPRMCDKWYHEENQEATQYSESEEQRPQVLLSRRRELALPLDIREGAIRILLRLWARR
jgi:hypothetical protein